MGKKGPKFSDATAVTPNTKAPVTLEILYDRGEILYDLIESKMGAIEVLRSALNQVFERLNTLEDDSKVTTTICNKSFNVQYIFFQRIQVLT